MADRLWQISYLCISSDQCDDLPVEIKEEWRRAILPLVSIIYRSVSAVLILALPLDLPEEVPEVACKEDG